MYKLKSVSEETMTEYQKIKAQGKQAPLEFLLDVMHNENLPAGIRIECAKAAMPYVHKKLPPEVEVQDEDLHIVQPYIPSRADFAEQFADELAEDI